MSKIIGVTVGTTAPRPNWTEENERSAAYIKNKPIIDLNLTTEGAIADAKATGDAIKVVQANIDNITETVSKLGDTYYTELEIDAIINAINADIALKAAGDHDHNQVYSTKGEVAGAIEDIKSYADNIKNDLLNGAGDTYDTLKELGDLIDENCDAIEALEKIAVDKADKNHKHDDVYYTEGEINEMLAGMQSAIEGKVEKDGDKVLSTHDFNDAYKDKLDGIDQTIKDINDDIKEIQDDYLTSDHQTQLQDSIKQVSDKVDGNTKAIAILNGESTQDGSVKHSINSAFNTFNNTIIEGINEHIGDIEDGIVAYKQEIFDQFGEFTKTVNDIDGRVVAIEEDFPAYQQEVTGQFEGLEQSINEEVEKIYDDLESHDHEELYYDKDEILGLITVEDIEDICRSTQSSDGNLDLVNVATQYWVKQNYQEKGNYLTEQDIDSHDTSKISHNDIRLQIEEIAKDFYTFADCDDETLNQLQQVVNYIKNNASLIESITTSKVSVTDIIDNLTTNVDNKPLSAAQGVVLKQLVDALQKEINEKFVETDDTLSKENAPADAKAVGDAIKNLNETKVSTTRKINGKPLSEDINLTAADIGVTTDKNLATEGVPADAKAVGDALSNYARASTVEALETLVGDTSVASQIADAIDDISNVVKYDVAQDLTDEQKAQARANIGVDDLDIEIDEISVQLGENGAIGGYKTGDVIAAGTDIKVILNKLFQKAIAATYKEPTLSLSNNGGTASGNIEAGSSITPKLIASFTKNDSGGLTSIKIMQGGATVASGTTAVLDYNGESIIIGDETITFTASADYSAAPVKNNNLGEESREDWFDADTVTSSYSITGRRQLFCGTGAGTLPTITSDVVRGLSGKKLAPANGNSFKINVAVGQQYIIIAYPIALRDVSNITYVEINDNMTSNFTKSIVQVADARGGDNGLVDYKVYTYEMKVQAEANMTFKVTI